MDRNETGFDPDEIVSIGVTRMGVMARTEGCIVLYEADSYRLYCLHDVGIGAWLPFGDTFEVQVVSLTSSAYLFLPKELGWVMAHVKEDVPAHQ